MSTAYVYRVVKIVDADGRLCWESIGTTENAASGQRWLAHYDARRIGQEQYTLRQEEYQPAESNPFNDPVVEEWPEWDRVKA